jgi:prepilin-type processing-associated H-X9-DG protein
MTSVFDGSEQRRLKESGEGYERKGKRGYIEPEERNTSLFLELLFGSNPLQHSKARLEKYKFELELLENEVPGIYVLKITEPEGQLYDLITVDANRGYNIVKRELFRSSDDVKLMGDDYELKRYPNGIWFLSKREKVRYTSGSDVLAKPRLEEKVTIMSVQFDTPEPGDEIFKLEFPPGTRVAVPGGEIVVGEDVEEELREVIESAEKLMGLGKALSIYANEDEKGRFPDTLKQLGEADYVSEEDLKWLLKNVEYLGKGKTAADAPDSPIAYDKTLLQKGKGTNVLFLDGHVGFEKPKRLEALGIRAAGE